MDIKQALHILKRDDLAWNTLNDFVMAVEAERNFRDNEINSTAKIPCQLCGDVDVELTIVCMSCLHDEPKYEEVQPQCYCGSDMQLCGIHEVRQMTMQEQMERLDVLGITDPVQRAKDLANPPLVLLKEKFKNNTGEDTNK